MIKLKLEANSIAELMEKMSEVMGNLQNQKPLAVSNQLEIPFEEPKKQRVKTIKEVALPANPKVTETVVVEKPTETKTETVSIDEIRTLQRSLIADYKEAAIGFVKAKLEAFNAPSLSELNPRNHEDYYIALSEFSEAQS